VVCFFEQVESNVQKYLQTISYINTKKGKEIIQDQMMSRTSTHNHKGTIDLTPARNVFFRIPNTNSNNSIMASHLIGCLRLNVMCVSAYNVKVSATDCVSITVFPTRIANQSPDSVPEIVTT
jgi:hypothetical protein